MEIRYFRSFIEVAERGHVGRAAEALNLAQPSLSYQIARLEEALGAELFERGPRGMDLTSAGSALLAELRPILKRIDGLAGRVQAAASGRTGTLTIGLVSGALLSGVASRAIREYRRLYPDVQLHVQAMLHVRLLGMLLDGDVDLAVFGSRLGDTELVGVPFMRETFTAVLPTGHALAAKKRIRYQDLGNAPLVALTRSAAPALFTHTLAVCAQHGYEPSSIEEASGEDAVIGLVAAGAGVAVVPDSWAAIRIPGTITRPLSPAGEGVTLQLFRRADNASPLVESFIEIARQYES
jgi:LysR family transcriptional regulator, benzoate and cis,cis-muconate-responsive activator of ben and cat genes